MGGLTRLQKAAKYYSEDLGFAIIPVGKDKKPLISWKEFQERFPRKDEVAGWWEKWPDANIGLITGKINSIFVIDIDEPAQGLEALKPYFRLEDLDTPVCKTTKGLHIYFQYFEGASNFTRTFQGTDGRGEGGYVIAPPSRINGGPEYTWEPGRGLHQKSPSPIPALLKDKLYNNNNNYNIGVCHVQGTKTDLNAENNGENGENTNVTSRDKRDNFEAENDPDVTQSLQNVTNVTIPDGTRDDYLFHVANQLAKAGTPLEEIRDVLIKLSAQCNPPFPIREIDAKIKSALDRSKRRNASITDAFTAWLKDGGPGTVTIDQAARDLGMTTPEQRTTLRQCFHRAVADKLIERKARGTYVVQDDTLAPVDPFASGGGEAALIMPLALDRYFRPMEKNIIVVAGASDSGKTALLLNIARDNIGNMPIRYFTSEMGPAELKSRLAYFDDTSTAEWKGVHFYERTHDFAAVIDPDGLNIIDFLEVTEDFFLVGRFIRDIFDKLNKGVAIIAIQKDYGRELGRGASLSIEKSRLYLSMDRGKIKIVKCKNWADPMTNPNGLELYFKLVKGCKFIVSGLWRRPAAEGENNDG